MVFAPGLRSSCFNCSEVNLSVFAYFLEGFFSWGIATSGVGPSAETTGGAEAVRDNAAGSFVVDIYKGIRKRQREPMRWSGSTCSVLGGSELRSVRCGRASVARCSEDARDRWLRFHHRIQESEVVLAFWT
jgi:hypothetical protein